MLRNEWTEAWDKEGNPKPLGMPLQGMVTMDAVRRTHRYATPESQKVGFNPVGQVVGQMNEVLSTRELIFKLVEEYVEATDRLDRLAPR
jgi:NAD(P)H-dependent flavin oxidoreductase YrpB (nitropropane dioxygenase family)